MTRANEAAVGVRATLAELVALDDRHGPARTRQIVSAGRPDDAAADDDDPAHPRIPVWNGSSESRISVDSAVMKASAGDSAERSGFACHADGPLRRRCQ